MAQKPAPSTPAVVETPPEVRARRSTQERIARGQQLIAAAESVVVTTPVEYEGAAHSLQALRGAYKDHEEDRKEITDPMRVAIQKVMDFFKPHGDALVAAGETIKGKLNAYDADQKRIADEARAKAEAEAKRQRDEAERKAKAERDAAEAEARRRRDEADRQRREQEAATARANQRRLDEERAARDAAEAKRRGDTEAAEKAAKVEADAKAAREAEEKTAEDARRAAARNDAGAARVEAKGEEKAQQLELTAASVVAPVIQTEAPKVGGIARRMVWKYKVTDPAKVTRLYLMLDEQKIAKIVKALGKDAEEQVGGIECWQENDISARATR
jgi:hypothetical protein